MRYQARADIVLVGDGCPDGTAAWVETHYPDIKVLRVDDDPGFRLSPHAT